MKVQILRRDGLEIVDLNRRKAIHEKCLNCSGWSHKEVFDCSFHDCPLHPFRMLDGRQNPKDRCMAIREYCRWCRNDRPSEIRDCPSVHCPLYSYRQGRLDRSQEIGSEAKLAHIEPYIEDKIQRGILV